MQVGSNIAADLGLGIRQAFRFLAIDRRIVIGFVLGQ
jgi:hypothetical protein